MYTTIQNGKQLVQGYRIMFISGLIAKQQRKCDGSLDTWCLSLFLFFVFKRAIKSIKYNITVPVVRHPF